MKPIEFREQNCIYAKDQPEYRPLPAHKCGGDTGEVIFCMKLTYMERLKILFAGKIWCSMLTFNEPLSPVFFTVNKKELLK